MGRRILLLCVLLALPGAGYGLRAQEPVPPSPKLTDLL